MGYFKDIIGIGSLDIDCVFFEANYPIFFSCIDKMKNLYLCVCCDIREEQRWIISKTTSANIIKVLTDKITLRDSLRSPEEEYYIVTWTYRKKEEKSYKVNEFNKINVLDLPTEGEYLEADEGEFDDYIDELRQRELARNIYYTDNINISIRTLPQIKSKTAIIYHNHNVSSQIGKLKWSRIIDRYNLKNTFFTSRYREVIYNEEKKYNKMFLGNSRYVEKSIDIEPVFCKI